MNIRKLKYINFALLFLGFVLCCSSAGAQDISQKRKNLEDQRNKLQKDIQRVSKGLQQVRSSRHHTLTEIKVLQNKLELRNKLIKNLNSEITYINHDIKQAENNIESVQRKLDTLREEYAKMVVYEYKNRHNYNTIFFLLSANSFNDAIKRFQYLRQYKEYRDHEADRIRKIEHTMKKKLDTLKEMKVKRSASLVSAKRQKTQFFHEKKVKDSMALSLKGNEKELVANIQAKKKKAQEISRKIVDVIRQQIEIARKRAAEEARKRAIAEARKRAESEPEPEENKTDNAGGNTRANNILNATPEAKALSASFKANKGKLPWPVSHAVVSELFGVHQHSVLSNITVDNDGIVLQTNSGATVKAVFKGKVVAVRSISGRWLVVLRHGEYFTVYANMAAATVSQGDQVGTNQPIGLAYTNSSTQETELDFKVYRSKTPVNPLDWLASN